MRRSRPCRALGAGGWGWGWRVAGVGAARPPPPPSWPPFPALRGGWGFGPGRRRLGGGALGVACRGGAGFVSGGWPSAFLFPRLGVGGLSGFLPCGGIRVERLTSELPVISCGTPAVSTRRTSRHEKEYRYTFSLLSLLLALASAAVFSADRWAESGAAQAAPERLRQDASLRNSPPSRPG